MPPRKELKVNTRSIKIEEVKRSIKKLKSGKLPGEDRVGAEMLKQKTVKHQSTDAKHYKTFRIKKNFKRNGRLG